MLEPCPPVRTLAEQVEAVELAAGAEERLLDVLPAGAFKARSVAVQRSERLRAAALTLRSIGTLATGTRP